MLDKRKFAIVAVDTDEDGDEIGEAMRQYLPIEVNQRAIVDPDEDLRQELIDTFQQQMSDTINSEAFKTVLNRLLQ